MIHADTLTRFTDVLLICGYLVLIGALNAGVCWLWHCRRESRKFVAADAVRTDYKNAMLNRLIGTFFIFATAYTLSGRLFW